MLTLVFICVPTSLLKHSEIMLRAIVCPIAPTIAMPTLTFIAAGLTVPKLPSSLINFCSKISLIGGVYPTAPQLLLMQTLKTTMIASATLTAPIGLTKLAKLSITMQLMAYLRSAYLSVLTMQHLNSSATKGSASLCVQMVHGVTLRLNYASVIARTRHFSTKITQLVKTFAAVTAHTPISLEIIQQVPVSLLASLHISAKLLESVLHNVLVANLVSLLEQENAPASVLMDGGANPIKQSASIPQRVSLF